MERLRSILGSSEPEPGDEDGWNVVIPQPSRPRRNDEEAREDMYGAEHERAVRTVNHLYENAEIHDVTVETDHPLWASDDEVLEFNNFLSQEEANTLLEDVYEESAHYTATRVDPATVAEPEGELAIRMYNIRVKGEQKTANPGHVPNPLVDEVDEVIESAGDWPKDGTWSGYSIESVEPAGFDTEIRVSYSMDPETVRMYNSLVE